MTGTFLVHLKSCAEGFAWVETAAFGNGVAVGSCFVVGCAVASVNDVKNAGEFDDAGYEFAVEFECYVVEKWEKISVAAAELPAAVVGGLDEIGNGDFELSSAVVEIADLKTDGEHYADFPGPGLLVMNVLQCFDNFHFEQA